ncbi:transposase [Oligoflexus sp.]|uniref:transposase n=1 Tax=Oligoflexus sp. TaxID=1971216 RepID=UPI0039C99A6C
MQRTGQKRSTWHRYPKLNIVCLSKTHLWAGMIVTMGPTNDSPAFAPAMREASRHIHFDRVLADAAYDSEANHCVCRKELGIKSSVIPARKRNSRKWPTTKFRRQMKLHFPTRIYRQRWQVESAISRHKRRLGVALISRSWPAQIREAQLRTLTHNLMIVACHIR